MNAVVVASARSPKAVIQLFPIVFANYSLGQFSNYSHWMIWSIGCLRSVSRAGMPLGWMCRWVIALVRRNVWWRWVSAVTSFLEQDMVIPRQGTLPRQTLQRAEQLCGRLDALPMDKHTHLKHLIKNPRWHRSLFPSISTDALSVSPRGRGYCSVIALFRAQKA